MWLLSKGQCVGCGTPLATGKLVDRGEEAKVTCSRCGRIFIHNKKANTYRRALFSEV